MVSKVQRHSVAGFRHAVAHDELRQRNSANREVQLGSCNRYRCHHPPRLPCDPFRLCREGNADGMEPCRGWVQRHAVRAPLLFRADPRCRRSHCPRELRRGDTRDGAVTPRQFGRAPHCLGAAHTDVDRCLVRKLKHYLLKLLEGLVLRRRQSAARSPLAM